jgi:hypothetical protein
MKAALIAGGVLLSVLTTALGAHAGEVLPNGEIKTCSGFVSNNEFGRGYVIQCKAIKGEDFDIDVEGLSNKEIDRLQKVCPLRAIGKDIAGMRSNRCRVQVIVRESPTKDDTFDALKLLHVTNKVKFSWE